MTAYEVRGKLARVREDFKGNLLVVGDIHGDLEAFEGVKRIFKAEPDPLLIFLGDYADRGEAGLEVVEGVRELMDRHSGRVIALKGNHEDYRDGIPFFSPWDLGAEVREKKGVGWTKFFPEFERGFLNRLLLAVLVPGAVLCVHGGMSSRLRCTEDLESPSPELEEDILWSDPWENPGECPNPRGAGVLFGPEISERVLGELGVRFLIRSHEPRKAFEGPRLEQGGRVFTMSSTGIYGGRAFLVRFKPTSKLTPTGLKKNVRYLS